jgi:hypothetical protein
VCLAGGVNVPKVTLDVPEEVAQLLKAMEVKLRREAQEARAFGDVDPAGALEVIDQAAEALQRDAKRRLLRDYDVDAPRLRLGDKLHARVGRYTATYKTRQGEVQVERSLYRQVGLRNGPTVDTISLRAGCVADGWLPEAARAMAYLLAHGTSREAEETARVLGVLPYSRSSFERVGHEVGRLYGEERVRVEAALAKELEVPRGTHGISMSLDRVAVPMEEPRPRRVGRPRKGAPQRPVDVVFRMAYVACLTFHDAKGEALATVRYGRMPSGGGKALAERLARDVQLLVSQQPALQVVVLTDGAPELHALLDEALAAHTPAVRHVVRLVDFWHLMEKLGAAALVLALSAKQAEFLRERWKLALLNRPGAVWQLVVELHASAKRDVVVADTRPVHEALTYLENHGERMSYAHARAQGLPIGSGNVEATCKSLVALRMKRPGSRWKEASGQHVLDLRSLVLSNRWAAAMDITLSPLRTEVRRVA